MVLGGGADHGRTADVDVLDTIVVACAFRQSRFERIEIDHQQVDRRDAVALHRLLVFGIVSDSEQTAMHLRMQRLDPSVHHFRKTRQFRNVGDFQSRGCNRLGGASGGDEIDAVAGERTRKFDQSGFIGDGQQSTGHAVVGHGLVLRNNAPGSTI